MCRHHRSGSVPQLLAYTYTKTAFPQHRRSRGQHTVCCTHNDRDTGFAAHTHTHIECIRATSHFEHQARMLDPQGFAAVTAATEDADIYDWLQWKLRHGLSTWKKPGEAGWIWKSRPGRVVRVLVWCTGARESEQTAPYAGEHQYGAQWWPCIVHIPDDDPLAPVLAFYCPALGWANGRPWLVYRSRCWLVPDDYRAILSPAPIKVDKVTDRQRRWPKDRHSDGLSTRTPSVHTSSNSEAASSSAGSSSSGLTAGSLASLAPSATTGLSTASAGYVTVNGVTFLAVNSFDDIEDEVYV